MSNIKKISFIALILLLIGIAGSVTFWKTNKHVSVSEEKIIDSTSFKNVRVDSSNADVEILPTDSTQAKIELTGTETNRKKHTFTAKVEGSTLAVKFKDEKNIKLFNFDFLFSSLQLKIYLPHAEYESLQVENGNGQVTISKIESKGVIASVANGTLEVKDVIASNVDVETSNGKIVLNHVNGKIKGKVDNGKIHVITEDLNRPVELATDNGSILIQTAEDPTNARFQADVDNGSINILDKYSNNAVVGKGENLIDLSTDNGSITVENNSESAE
jgi:DUF4097 and DUF4098 domain-containing protein YvlB